MKILVTGGVGFIGSNLIRRLLSDGHSVCSLDNYSTGKEENEVSGCKYYRCDLTDISTIMDRDFDVIFHLAALARIQPSFTHPSETFRSNVLGTEAVLEFARTIGAAVVYAGSSSRWHDPRKSPYAMSKYLSEELCKMYRQSFGCNIQIARFYNVYGPGEIMDGDYATVIGVWRRQIRYRDPLTVVGDGEQRRDFTHVDDIVDGLVRIMNTEYYHDDAWELGTGVNYSINELYVMFSDRFGSICSRVDLPDLPGNYRITLREHGDALEKLGWAPVDRLRTYISGLEQE
jgi:UDP-glucose 4-epimerase